MSEWPKTAHDIWGAWEGVGEDDEELPGDFKVVPADLAQELYEAADEFCRFPLADDGSKRKRLAEVLARYEREVGE